MKYNFNNRIYEKLQGTFVALKGEDGSISFITEENFTKNAKQVELTGLTEFWATELSEDVKLWIKMNFKSDSYNHKRGFFHYPNFCNQKGFINLYHSSSDVQKEYTKITPEQFKEWVLHPFLYSEKMKQIDATTNNNK